MLAFAVYLLSVDPVYGFMLENSQTLPAWINALLRIWLMPGNLLSKISATSWSCYREPPRSQRVPWPLFPFRIFAISASLRETFFPFFHTTSSLAMFPHFCHPVGLTFSGKP